ncbi:MAG: DedA family protein [Thermodesulfobacteriota bacterium]
MESIPQFLSHYGYLGIFLLLMVGIVGLPIPDEIILMFAGYLIFKGSFQPVPTAATALLGTFCGITVSYSLGRSAGFYFLQKYGHYLHISLARLARTQAWFHRVGKWAIFFGYFIMGVRHLAALTAGASRMRFRVFALFAYSGGFLWTLSYVYLGYFLGEELPKLSPELRLGFLIATGIVILSISAFFICRHFKNRRLAS